MILIILLAILGGLVLPFSLYQVEIRKLRTPALILKTLSSCTFVALGFVCGQNSSLPDFVKIVLIGEIFGAIGDVIINLGPFVKNAQITFCVGGGSFVIGHIFYIVAICLVNSNNIWLSLLLALAVFIPICLLLFKLTKTDKVMRILTTLYMAIVSSFFAFSLASLVANFTWQRGILTLGALIFLFSDFDLMLQNMGIKKWKFVFPCMYVYYPAQIVIALSLYWFI